MGLLHRTAALAAGTITAVLVSGTALVAPSAAGSDDPPVAEESIAKAPSRLVAKTGNHSSNVYDFFALGTLNRRGKHYPGKLVVLQAKVDGRWERVDSARTNVAGTVTWYFKPSSLRWRMKFGGDPSTRGDRTSPFGFGGGKLSGAQSGVDPASLVSRAG
jgi:hypothetical protein